MSRGFSRMTRIGRAGEAIFGNHEKHETLEGGEADSARFSPYFVSFVAAHLGTS